LASRVLGLGHLEVDMRVSMLGVLLLAGSASADVSLAPASSPEVNPAIDMRGFLLAAEEAAHHRESRRLDEADFLRLSQKPEVVVIDARSAEKYAELHIAGAVNLSFPDITVDSLARLLPDKNTTILIYCNNNFRGEPSAFPTKLAPASLNLSTYISLYTYGYRNVYELGPLIDIDRSILPFERAGQRQQAMR
jgi:hypothetical protein